MNRSTAVLGVVTLFSVCAQSAHALRQVNSVRQAPSIVNTAGDDNEYPWFTYNGDLLLWTRQPSGAGVQRVWVAHFKNRTDILNTPDGQNLPDLDLSTPMPLTPVNSLVSASTTIKAIATCTETQDEEPQPSGGNLRHRFTLFMAVGPPGGDKEIMRARRVFVDINPNTDEIVNMGISGSFLPVAGTNVAGRNETEPMLTYDDDEYLFWGSSVFAGTVARFIGPFSNCDGATLPSKPYDELPAGRFAWRDQYVATQYPDGTKTSRTHYHTVIERPNGDTALIFETCHGQVDCPMGSRDCFCEQTRPHDLKTTGFVAGGQPTVIQSCCSAPLHGDWRVSHPAISGERATNGSWLLFSMRGKKIWYTRIKE